MTNYPPYRLLLSRAFIGLLLTSSLWGCGKEHPIEPAPDLPNRTILYFLGADNNLQVEADEKTEALRLGFPGGNNRLVIYRDSEDEVPQLLEVYPDMTGENKIRTVKTYPEQNSAAGETLQLLLADITQLFTADSYGLILFSHASGWLPGGTLTRPESALLQMGVTPINTYTVVMDGTSELDLKEFAEVIPDRFFAFIAFESCFMAGIEVLYELKDKTDYILSSSAEIVSPGFTPVYPEALPLLFKPAADLAGFARAFFDFWNGQSGDYRSATVTVAKTAGLPSLATWIQQYATTEVPLEDVSEIQHFDRYRSHRLFFDFGSYYQRKVELVTENQLNNLLNDIVVYKAATPSFIPGQLGFEITRHSGITTYIPQDRFPKLNERYRELAWYEHIQPRP